MSNISSLFFIAAATHPRRAAIIDRHRSITYAELVTQVRRTAGHFQRSGIRRGDRVLVFVPMSIDLYRIVLALFSMGATAVFLDAWVNRRRLGLCCELADPRAVIGGWKVHLLSLISRPVRSIPIKLGVRNPEGVGIDPIDVEPDAVALITFTTGSTGTPKAALRSHDFLAHQFSALREEIDPRPEDVDLTTLPIVLFVNLGVGCTSVIPDFKPGDLDAFDAGRVMEQLRDHGVTRLSASPSQVVKLAEHMVASGQDPSVLRKIFTGGAPVFPREAKAITAGFPDAHCMIVYGSTEAEPISSIGARELVEEQGRVERGLCVGRVFHRTSLKIIRIADVPISIATMGELTAMTLPAGEIGEIIVAGDHVLAAYFNNEEAFRRNKIVVEGRAWHRTGDSGFLDAGGCLFLTGRCAQLIRRGATIHAPFVWEDRLRDLPGITRGTVIEQAGRITAVIEAAVSIDRRAVEVELMKAHPTIEQVLFLARMPMDPRHRSKIDHEALRAQVKG